MIAICFSQKSCDSPSNSLKRIARISSSFVLCATWLDYAVAGPQNGKSRDELEKNMQKHIEIGMWKYQQKLWDVNDFLVL